MCMSCMCMSRMTPTFKKKYVAYGVCRVWTRSIRHITTSLYVSRKAPVCGVQISLSRHVLWRLVHTWHTCFVSIFNTTNPTFHTPLAYVFLVVFHAWWFSLFAFHFSLIHLIWFLEYGVVWTIFSFSYE